MQDIFAWQIGSYTLNAMGAWLGKNHRPYPDQPRGMAQTEVNVPANAGSMSDGARFAAFAVEHRRRIREGKSK